jgi:hypothetical protein
MLEDESPITGHSTAVRRVKYVPSHEVGHVEVGQGEIQPFHQELEQQVYIPNPVFDDLADPDAPAAIDPTQIGRPRPRRHRVRYRLAQLSTAAALAATAAAVIGVALADRKFTNIVSIIALVSGFLAVYLSMRSRMASKILGYAIAACALSALTAAIALTLPRHWFEDRHPEELPPAADVRPRVQQ